MLTPTTFARRLLPRPTPRLAAPAHAAEWLGELAKTLTPQPNRVRVEGYTDDRPIKNAIYPSNWELSAARAGSVVRLFVENGIAPRAV